MKRIMTLFIILICSTLLATPAGAATILSEPFDDNSNGWYPAGSGTWVISGGNLSINHPWWWQTNYLVDITPLQTTGNRISISVDLKYVSGAPGFRNNITWYWEGTNNMDSLLTGKEHSFISLWQSGSGGAGWLDGAPKTYSFDTWYNVKLELQGNKAWGYIDDVLFVQDTVVPRNIGTVGLAVWNTNAVFDNFVVESTPIPDPGAVWLFGSGLIGLIGLRRRGK